MEQECNNIFDENILIIQPAITGDPNVGLVYSLKDDNSNGEKEDSEDFVDSYKYINNEKLTLTVQSTIVIDPDMNQAYSLYCRS